MGQDCTVFSGEEYVIWVSRTLWQVLWRVDCRVEGRHLSRPLPRPLSGRVQVDLTERNELSPETRDKVHAFAREALIEPFRERERAIREAAGERRSARAAIVVVMVIGAIASFVFVAVVLLADGSDNGGNTLSGTFTLRGRASIFTIDDECIGTRGYDDIRAGTSVVVKNEEGKVIATGDLSQGSDRLGLGYSCRFQFTVDDLPDAEFYSIAVSHRGELTYSRQELQENDWKVAFSLGD